MPRRIVGAALIAMIAFVAAVPVALARPIAHGNAAHPFLVYLDINHTGRMMGDTSKIDVQMPKPIVAADGNSAKYRFPYSPRNHRSRICTIKVTFQGGKKPYIINHANPNGGVWADTIYVGQWPKSFVVTAVAPGGHCSQ